VQGEDKTIGEMILDLSRGETQLPIFRHFIKKYSRKYNPHSWCVSVHPNMSETAVDTLSKLKVIITAKYGADAGKLIGVAESYASKAGVQNSTFKPDENAFDFLDTSKDWYLAGNAKCMIEGMEVVESAEEKLALDNAVLSVDESKITFLSGLKTADEDKTVATGGGVSFGGTNSLKSYDSTKSAWEGHVGSDDSTVGMKQPESEEDSPMANSGTQST
jgi:hypothetical protein